MKIKELLSEAPLVDYEPLGDFTKPGPFSNPIEKALVQHPVQIEKAYRLFKNTPYNFRLFPANVAGTSKYRESGEKTPEEIRKIFGKYADRILTGSEDAITVVYVGNAGADKVLLTPWLMAHRFGHALSASVPFSRAMRNDNIWQQTADQFFSAVNDMLTQAYGKTSKRWDRQSQFQELIPEYNALFNAIGTQRSSRTNKIKRPYEFLYEILTQYLKEGEITFNPIPQALNYGRQAWGRPTRYLRIKPEFRDELARQEFSAKLARDMEYAFERALGANVGKIFVM